MLTTAVVYYCGYRLKGTDRSGYPTLPLELEQGSSPGTLGSAVSLGFKQLQDFLRKE